MGAAVLPPGVMWLGRRVDRALVSSAEVENDGSCASMHGLVAQFTLALLSLPCWRRMWERVQKVQRRTHRSNTKANSDSLILLYLVEK